MQHTNRSTSRRSRMGGTLLIVIGVLVLISAAVFAVMYFNSGGTAEKSKTSTADLVAADKGTFEIRTLATGELEAKNRIELRNKLDKQATIVDILPEGSFVQAGDVLVRLNADTIEDSIVTEELALDEAKAELLSAETAYEIQQSENDSRLRSADLKVRLADLALKEWSEGDDVRQMQELDLAIEQAEREVKRLTEKFDRNQELLAKNFISRDQYQQDESAKIKADAQLIIAKLNKKVYESYTRLKNKEQKESDLAEAKAELARTEQENAINLSSRQATVTNRQRQVQRREDRLSELREQFEFCTIVAPSAGLVVYGTTVQSDNFRFGNEGPLQVGRSVSPNDLLIVLPDTSQMVARVKVHESLAGRVRPGQTAEVQIDAAGKKSFVGTVESIGVMAESGGWRDPNRREYSVRVTLDPDQDTEDLKPSMRCEARIRLGVVEDVVNVPVQAVFIDGPVTYVYTPEGGKYRRQPVQLGRRSDTRAEIVSGLAASEPVLLRTPSPGEIIAAPWKPEELKAAGYALDENGSPVPPMAMMGQGARQRPAGQPGGQPGAGARPGGQPGAGARPGQPGNDAVAAQPSEGATTGDDGQSEDTQAAQPAADAGQPGQRRGPRGDGAGGTPRTGDSGQRPQRRSSDG